MMLCFYVFLLKLTVIIIIIIIIIIHEFHRDASLEQNSRAAVRALCKNWLSSCSVS